MTFFVLLTAVVLVLLAVTIHLGAMHWLNVLMPRWSRLNRFRVGIIVLAAIIAHVLEIGLFALGLGILLSSGDHGQLVGAFQSGFTNDFYYSAVAYTALSFGDISPTGSLRLLAAIEALTGLVLIAWTESAIFLTMRQYWEADRSLERHHWNFLGNKPVFDKLKIMSPTGPTHSPLAVYLGGRSSRFLTSATLTPTRFLSG